MSSLSGEVRNVQNPALGAILLWRFACGYWDGHPNHAAAPLIESFFVLPILLHEETASFIKNTQKDSGLRAFAAKFGEAKTSKQDVLLAIHERITIFRKLTLESLRLALSSRLVSLELNGSLIPLSRTQLQAGVPERVRPLLRAGEKLGHWFAQVTVHEIGITLKVRP
jgi:hypothetical protein